METKRKKTVQDIEKLNVVIRKGYSHQQLVKMILAEHQNDDNFIRHELTSYDYDLGELYQRVDRSAVNRLIQNIVKNVNDKC